MAPRKAVLVLILLCTDTAGLSLLGLDQLRGDDRLRTRPYCSCEPDIDDFTTGPPDPGRPGPCPVLIRRYDFGDGAADIPDFDDPVEMRGEVYYPADLDCCPFPVAFFMHGNHATCYSPDLSLKNDWPCEGGDFPLPNYRGYHYVAEVLASHGIIVVSISANGINAGWSPGPEERAQLFRLHVELWDQLSSVGGAPFGNLFVGKVDMDRIGLMGHSRGGGGAARYVDLNEAQGSPFGVKAVLLVGAVNGWNDDDLVIQDTALGVVLPYCDGDQQNLPSTGYYDASRYAVVGETAPKHSFLVLGANHNKYNIYWDPDMTALDAGDDWVDVTTDNFCNPEADGNGRLTSAEQQGTLIAIGSAFFRRYLKGESTFDKFLKAAAPPPASAKTDGIHVAYHAPEHPEWRMDINRLTDSSEAVVNTSGGNVTAQSLVRLEHCDPLDALAPYGCLTALSGSDGRVPHAYSDSPVSLLRVAWDSPRITSRAFTTTNFATPVLTHELGPDFRDVSGYHALQFRAYVDFTDPLNPFDQPQDLRIVLKDGAGLQASAAVSDYSRSLFFPPSLPSDLMDDFLPIPRAVLNTVRLPLSAFTGVLLNDIREVRMVFDQTDSGALNIADVAFADRAKNLSPSVSCSLLQDQLPSGGNQLVNVGLNAGASDDHDTAPPVDVFVYSDEDDTDSENQQNSPDAKGFAPGQLRLRGERDKNGDGRVYVVLVKSTDSSGAVGDDCCTVIVPMSQKAADVESVIDQAAAAIERCTAFAAASEGLAGVPAGYFEVGDGPVMGPIQ